MLASIIITFIHKHCHSRSNNAAITADATVTHSHQGQRVMESIITYSINHSINQSIGICIAPPTNRGRRRLTM